MIRVTRSTIIDAPIEQVWSVLRDFNSHSGWHPIVAQSVIEGDEPADRVGCVRRFVLQDGARVREQLIALSDPEHSLTYCILEADLPLERYVATGGQARHRRTAHVLALAIDVPHRAGASASSPSW